MPDRSLPLTVATGPVYSTFDRSAPGRPSVLMTRRLSPRPARWRVSGKPTSPLRRLSRC